jgi:L-asparaginase/Glu-tRNA(Gln) amidotransferase subunit D
VSTFSTNPNREGRVLIIAIGGAGIPQVYKNVNDNLRLALEKVPYLSDNAEKIDYLALFRKDSADLTVEDVANIARTIYRHHTPISD